MKIQFEYFLQSRYPWERLIKDWPEESLYAFKMLKNQQSSLKNLVS